MTEIEKRESTRANDLSAEVQTQVTRIRDLISTTKQLMPDANVNFVVYEMHIEAAEQAVREQDAVALVQLLPILKSME